MTAKAILFHADDLGLFPGVEEGVLRAAEAGVIAAASISPTGPASASAARAVKRLGEGFAIGLHLALTEGRSLTGRIGGVTDSHGRFPPPLALLARAAGGGVDEKALRREIEAQWDHLGTLGLSPGHLDGHHHVHVFPRIREQVLAVVEARRIPYVRVPLEIGAGAKSLSARRVLLARLARGFVGTARASGCAARTLPFVGLSLQRRPDYGPTIERVAARIGPPAVEWMVHPDALDPRRAAETEALGDPTLPSRLAALGARPARYADVEPALVRIADLPLALPAAPA